MVAANKQPDQGGTESLPSILHGRDCNNLEDYREAIARYQDLFNHGLHKGPEGVAIKAWIKQSIHAPK
jgi:hypothetical protein